MARKRVQSIGELKNVYYMYGDEELLAEGALARLRERLGAEVDPDFNMEVLDAAEAGADKVIDAAETIPLLSPRRLVVVRAVDGMSRADQAKLARYLESPNPATILVLVARFPQSGQARDAKSLKRVEGTALFKAAAGAGEVLKFSMGGRGKRARLEEFVTECFKKREIKATPEARDALLERTGNDLREIEGAVERISLYTGEQPEVGVPEVELLTVPRAERDVFEFVDAVAERRRDLALYLFNRLMRQGETPQRLFGLLLRQYRLISRVKSLSGDHDYGEIAGKVGVPPFIVGKCLQQSKRYSSERLRGLFAEFKRAQVEMHSTRYLPEREYQESVIEMLIVRIIG